jgi:hypothetical protein
MLVRLIAARISLHTHKSPHREIIDVRVGHKVASSRKARWDKRLATVKALCRHSPVRFMVEEDAHNGLAWLLGIAEQLESSSPWLR